MTETVIPDTASPERPSWDSYFMRLSQLASERSTCDRAHVGCVLVVERQVIATGYNGSLPGQDHCDDAGHLLIDGRCRRTTHAEANAVARAARHGVTTRGASAYVTHMPCLDCIKLLITAGVTEIVHLTAYRPDTDHVAASFAHHAGVTIRQFVP